MFSDQFVYQRSVVSADGGTEFKVVLRLTDTYVNLKLFREKTRQNLALAAIWV